MKNASPIGIWNAAQISSLQLEVRRATRVRIPVGRYSAIARVQRPARLARADDPPLDEVQHVAVIVGQRRVAQVAALLVPARRAVAARCAPDPAWASDRIRADVSARRRGRDHRVELALIDRHPDAARLEQRHGRQLERLAAGGAARPRQVELALAARAAQHAAARARRRCSGSPHEAHSSR